MYMDGRCGVFLTDERVVCYVDMNMVIHVTFSVVSDRFQ